MARAQLHDDRPGLSHAAAPSPAGWHVGLDDDPRRVDEPLSWGSGPDADGVVGPVLTQALWDLSHVTVLNRSLAGFDDDGNAMWGWAPAIEGVEATEDLKERSEVSDVDAASAVRTAVTFLYPATSPTIADTAQVIDASGNRWNVVAALRSGGSYRMKIEMVERSQAMPPAQVV